MSQSVASSEPSSVGLPVGTWSLAGDSITSNSFHRHRNELEASIPPHYDDPRHANGCPLCGNQDNRTDCEYVATACTNANRSFKTTGMATDGTVHIHKNLRDFELSSMFQSAQVASNHMIGEAETAASMGACWVCIAAIADATNGQLPQQVPATTSLLSSSFSTLESFQDENSNAAVTAVLSPKAIYSVNDFENEYLLHRITTGNEQREEERMITMATTVVYIGEYNDRGQRHGPHGELIWDNGDRYVGSFVCGKRTGTGTMFHRDGSCYTGDWLNNKMHGKGQRTFANGDVYVGAYQHGQRCGGPDCKLKFSNGDLYVGNWDSNYFHGFGRYYFADGTVLEGNFQRGKKQGKFKRQKPNGDLDILRYENDQAVGNGVRWNAARTKTWLLRTVPDKKQQQQQQRQQQTAHHRRIMSEDTLRVHSHEYSVVPRDGACRNSFTILPPRNRSSDTLRQDSSNSSQSTEPLVDAQVMTVTKTAGRIPIAQAVSIGYDCELGGAIRDTNPAFWSIGDFAGTETYDGAVPNDSTTSFV
ncbi:TIR domain containing protein [Nitzschia inconspicua]|uniref:TIR domain containing protein n=1 Tax=Nitzschia inconspicua TaxID=303405 RepID=A0A9K3KQ30_9STRA|nr:TIR domain containing protein [Nitzschia inconspicua]